MNVRASATAAALVCVAAAMLPPKVDSITPLGGQRGTQVELTLRGARLGDPQALLLTRPGIEVLGIAPGKDASTCTVQLRLAADCPLGSHPLRLRTAAGLSNLGQFFVGANREIAETRKTNEPMLIEAPLTIDGSITGEEVDRYALTLGAGAHCIAEVEGMRLGRGPIDLTLSVVGPDGAEIARADDTALGHKDPWLAFDAASAGTYEVRVEPAYADGNNAGAYRLHLGDLPRPTAAIPAGGAPGSTFAAELLGDHKPLRNDIALPDNGDEWCAYFATDARGTAPTPIWLRAGGPPEAARPADGAAFPQPCSITGVVTKPAGERYPIRGKKGEAIELRALTLGMHSPLDPVLAVLRPDGRWLAGDDDTGGPAGDSFVRFTPPEDGDYLVEVRDLLRRSSPLHAFRLEIGARAKATRCRLVVVRGQEPLLTVPQGGCGGMVLQLDDADVDAGLAFVASALPTGVTASFGRIQKGANLIPFVLQAAADAPLAGALADLALKAEKEPHERPAGYAQPIALVTVRNDQPILQTTMRRIPVAVSRTVPFTVSVTPPKVPLVRGAPLLVQVQVVRAAGFAGDVRVKALWTPPGVGSGEVNIAANTDTGLLPLDANGNAPLGAFPLAVLASSTLKDEGFEQCSPFAEVTVDKPWLTAQTQGARTLPGNTIQLPVSWKGEHELQGPLQIQLLGLPRGVTAQPQAIALDAAAFQVPVAIATDAATGKFRELALEVRVPHNGAEVVHRFPVGEVRIDAPPKKRATPNAMPAGKEQP